MTEGPGDEALALGKTVVGANLPGPGTRLGLTGPASEACNLWSHVGPQTQKGLMLVKHSVVTILKHPVCSKRGPVIFSFLRPLQCSIVGPGCSGGQVSKQVN